MEFKFYFERHKNVCHVCYVDGFKFFKETTLLNYSIISFLNTKILEHQIQTTCSQVDPKMKMIQSSYPKVGLKSPKFRLLILVALVILLIYITNIPIIFPRALEPQIIMLDGTGTKNVNLQFLFEKYRPEILYSTKDSFLVNTKSKSLNLISLMPPIKIKVSKNKYEYISNIKMSKYEACQAQSLFDLFQISQNDRVNLSSLYPDLHSHGDGDIMHNLSIFPQGKSTSPSKAEMLIVYTTCNQISMTILSLQFLRNTDKLGDIIVIDDHSTDGTVEYLRKKGYAVITKPKATGIIDSWNIGYRLAVALGYKNILFTNNDVLLTSSAVHLINLGLRLNSLVVPLTTKKGAGHLPIQSFIKAHNLPRSMDDYVNDYRNTEIIQESLLRKYVNVTTG